MLISSGLLHDICMIFFMGVILLFIAYFKLVRPELQKELDESMPVTFVQKILGEND